MPLEADEIAARIPHGNSMSLLDRVTRWDPQHIVCSTRAHTREDNPLRENGQLFTVTLVEFAAQAAAIHASLLQSGMGESGPAYLGAVRSLSLKTELIPTFAPDHDAELTIQATAELHSNSGAVYYFVASIQESVLAEGRLVLAQPDK